MTTPSPHHYLVCYDVTDNKRLGRIHRFLLEHGIPLQYSVFLLQTTPSDMQNIIEEIKQIIDERHDDVRIYPLPHRPRLFQFGEAPLPEEAHLFNDKGHTVWG